MEKIYMGMLCILSGVELMSFCYTVLGKRRGNLISIRWILPVLFMGLILISIMSGWGRNLVFNILQVGLICFLWYYYSDTWRSAIKIWIVTYLLFSVLEAGIHQLLLSFDMVVGYESAGDTRLIWQECIYVGIVIILLWLYYGIVGRRIDRNAFQLSNKISIVVGIILFLVVAMMTFFLYITEHIFIPKMMRVGSVLIILGGAGICGMVMVLIYSFNKIEIYRVQNEMAEGYNEQQREYFERLLEREQKTKMFRHDMANHLVAMRGLCTNREYASLEQYLDELLLDMKTISKQQYDVGNEIINTIINYYFSPLEGHCKIQVKGYVDSLEWISKKDLCVIVSNLTKNATEAVMPLKDEERNIKFQICQGMEYINICVENTMDGKLIIENNGIVRTTKEDKQNHGFGLRNVREILQHYHGNYNEKVENGRYIADITIKIDRSRS